jgi:putative hydrolase of the HAD superfamily
MRPFFEFEVTREDVSQIKPDPEVYLQALERADLSADQAVVIEDTPRGITAAKSAEIFTIAIPNEFTRGLDFSEADVVLHNIAELPGFLGVKEV